MGIDIISWRIRIGAFSPKATTGYHTVQVIQDTSSNYHAPLKLMIFLAALFYISSLVICMDIETNPGPPFSPAESTPQFTSLFNTTKRIQLKLIRYQHHLKNYEFYTANNIIPRGLLPHCLPAFDSNNFWFHRQWKNICFITARRHLTLLTKECRTKIKHLYKELSNCKKLLEEHCTPETFSFYISRINSMALSLESLLARRRANKTHTSHVTNPNVTVSYNLNTSLNNNTAQALTRPQSSLFLLLILTRDARPRGARGVMGRLPSVVLLSFRYPPRASPASCQERRLGTSQAQAPTRTRNRRKRKPRNTHTTIRLDTTSVINLSQTPLSYDESSVLARGLTFCPTPRRINWSEVSADINDFTRHMRLTEYFHDYNNASNPNQTNPFHNKSSWTPPTNRDSALNAYIDAIKHDISISNLNHITDNLTSHERQSLRNLKVHLTPENVFRLNKTSYHLQYFFEKVF